MHMDKSHAFILRILSIHVHSLLVQEF